MTPTRLTSSAIAAATLWFAVAAAHAVEPFSLGGHALGLRFEAVLNDPDYDCDSQAGCFLYSACAYKGSGATAFKGAPIEGLMLYFTGERLSGIEASFEAGRFDQMVNALAQEYGPGAAEGRDDAIYTWRQGSRVLRVERLAGDARRASVIVAERNFISELIEKP